jgi:hypothetical protein
MAELLPVNQELDDVMHISFPPDSVPEYNQPPVFVEALEDYVHFGSFVKMKIPAPVNNNGSPTEREIIVRLIRRRSSGHILVEHYKPLESSSGAVLGDSYNLVKQLYKSSTGWMVKNPLPFIKSIAFVFHPEVFEESSNEWAIGMTNLFFARKKSVLSYDRDVGELIDIEDTLCPFPSRSPTTKYLSCLPQRIWNGLEQIYRMTTSILNRRAESQGETCVSSEKQFFGCMSAINHLSRMSIASNMEPRHLETSASIAHTDPCGLTRKKTKYTSEAVFIRFETTEHLSILRAIIGSTITCGLRKRSPRSGESTNLLTNDSINIVVGSAEAEIPYRRRTTKRGLDFLITSKELKVTCRYEKYLYKRLRSGEILNCPDELLAQMIKCFRDTDNINNRNDENQAPLKVVVGDYFSFNSEFCKVEAVTSKYVEVKVMSPNEHKGVTRQLLLNDPAFAQFIAQI